MVNVDVRRAWTSMECVGSRASSLHTGTFPASAALTSLSEALWTAQKLSYSSEPLDPHKLRLLRNRTHTAVTNCTGARMKTQGLHTSTQTEPHDACRQQLQMAPKLVSCGGLLYTKAEYAHAKKTALAHLSNATEKDAGAHSGPTLMNTGVGKTAINTIKVSTTVKNPTSCE